MREYYFAIRISSYFSNKKIYNYSFYLINIITMGGYKDWSENLKNSSLENQETGTNKIQRKSTKEVRENFQSLNKEFLQKNLELLVKVDPNIKRIIEIPELQDLRLERIDVDGNHRLRIGWSTSFDGNLRQLLLKHGFNKNNLISHTWATEKVVEKLIGNKQIPKIWVRICLYWSSLQFFIKQETLSK